MSSTSNVMNLSDYAEQHGLNRVGARPNISRYLRQVWERRTFIFMLARSRIQARSQQNRLGFAWLIITPLIDALVYGTVFGLLQGDKRPDHFILFLLVGIFLFRLFSDCVSAGARAVINNQALVQTLNFPRMVLPLAVVAEHVINFLPVLVVLLLLSIPLGAVPSIQWLLLIPVLLLYIVFNTGVVLIMARIAVSFRDIGQIIPFSNRFMRYFSGVFYDPAVFLAGFPAAMFLFTINPVYNFLEFVRYALIPNYQLDITMVVSGITWTLVTIILGGLFFWRSEEHYGRIS